jgi:hypothetical protein
MVMVVVVVCVCGEGGGRAVTTCIVGGAVTTRQNLGYDSHPLSMLSHPGNPGLPMSLCRSWQDMPCQAGTHECRSAGPDRPYTLKDNMCDGFKSSCLLSRP